MANERGFNAIFVVAIAAIYVVLSVITQHFAEQMGHAVVLWPAAGVALAATLRFGAATSIPAVSLGSLLGNLITAASHGPPTTAAIAAFSIVAVITALVAASQAHVVARMIPGGPRLGQALGVTLFVVVVAPVGALVSASVASVALTQAGIVPGHEAGHVLVTWWLGDALGVILIGCPLLPLVEEPAVNRRRSSTLAVVGAILAVVIVAGSQHTAERVEDQRANGLRHRQERVQATLAQIETRTVDAMVALEASLADPQGRSQRRLELVGQQLFDHHRYLRSASWNVAAGPEAHLALIDELRRDNARPFATPAQPGVGLDGLPAVVVRHITPLADGGRALGLNVAAEPTRAEALRWALASRRPTRTLPLSLIQDPSRSDGALIFMPVISQPLAAAAGSATSTGVFLEDGRLLDGFATLVANHSNLFRELDQIAQVLELRVQLVDSGLAGEDSVLFVSGPSVPDLATDASFDFTFLERPLTARIEVDAHASWWSAQERWALLATLALAAACIMALSLVVTGRQVEIELEVARRTERLRAVARTLQHTTKNLQDERGRLVELITSAPDTILELDAEGCVCSVNPEGSLLFDRPPEEIVGCPVSDLFHDELGRDDEVASEGVDPSHSGVALAARSSEGAPLTNFDRAQRPDGERWPVEVRISRRKREEGGYTLFVRDIRDRVAAEARRRELEDELKRGEHMRLTGRFASGIAHDFNNLMVPVMVNAELLRDRLRSGAEQEELLLDEILASTRRGRELVRGLLAFGRSEAVDHIVQQLESTVGEALRLVRVGLSPSITLSHEASEVDACVKLGPGELHQVVVNLCTNAAQAIGDGPGTIRIGTRTAPGPDGVMAVITVDDDGPGVPPALQAQIFEPFFTTKAIDEGTGLGLSVVDGIVGRAGGQVHVEDSPLGGARFRVELPVVHERPSEADTVFATGPATKKQGLRVVLVDDEEVNLTAIARSLGQRDFDVTTFDDARAALAALERGPGFDALVTDLAMPGMDGEALVSALSERGIELPVIVLSGLVEHDVETRLMRTGVAKVICKPVTVASLASTIHDVCQRSERSAQASRTTLS